MRAGEPGGDGGAGTDSGYEAGVFSIGYCSRALSKEYYQMDRFDSEELPRMDETIFFRKNNGKDYFYFAAYK